MRSVSKAAGGEVLLTLPLIRLAALATFSRKREK